MTPLSNLLTLSSAPPLLAFELDVDSILAALIYSVLGLVMFGVFWMIVIRLSPFSIRKEIEEDQNTALGIILGAIILGIAMIISAAVKG